MIVKDLIKILEKCGPDLPIATYACNNTYSSGIDSDTAGDCRVALLHTYGGDHVIIGNIGIKEINPPNWYIKKELDTLGEIRSEPLEIITIQTG